MSILKETGIGDPVFQAAFAIYSGRRTVEHVLRNSGEYKALLMRLRNPKAPDVLLEEMRAQLLEQRQPGYLNPMDIAFLACKMALVERKLYSAPWDALTAEHATELFWGRYQPAAPEIVV
jgi:hypothetical protein